MSVYCTLLYIPYLTAWAKSPNPQIEKGNARRLQIVTILTTVNWVMTAISSQP